MRFLEKTDCEFSLSNGTYKKASSYPLHFVADSRRCSSMISNLL